MNILNDRGWCEIADQFPLSRLVLSIRLLLGAVLKIVVFCPIALSAESESTPSPTLPSGIETQTNHGVEAVTLFAEAEAEGRVSAVDGSVEQTSSDATSLSATSLRRMTANSTEISKRPSKDAELVSSTAPLPDEGLLFVRGDEAEAISPSTETSISISPGSPTELTSSAPASSAEGYREQSHAVDLAQDLINEEATDIPPSESPVENYQPLLQYQAATIFQDDELSGRLRASALYALNDQVLFGATVDLVGGEAFVDSADEGLSINELYVAAAPFHNEPNLRFVAGLIDLTGYLDRNSFAKDVVTHFFNPAFQTNPALSAAGIGSRPGLLVNWSATDQIEIKAAAFSSSRDLGDLALDGFAAEAGFRTGNFIIRGTFTTDRDAGDDTGFGEIFQIQRSDGSFGLREDDREVAYGINAEYFIEDINVGLFGRYGWYENQDVNRGGVTFSFGANALDVFLEGDRLGLGYGQQLSNSDLRSGKTPDVWEVFYDAPVYSQVRVGVSLQSRDELSDTGLGFRIRADW